MDSEGLVWEKHLLVLLAKARFLIRRCSGFDRSLRIGILSLQRMKSDLGGVLAGHRVFGDLVTALWSRLCS